jgi:hypothetical protein
MKNPLTPEREQLLRELAARATDDSFFVSDCEGDLQVWREAALVRVHRDEAGTIDMYSFPSTYRSTDEVIRIDLDTWDPGEDATDDQRRQDIGDLATARAAVPELLAEVDRLRRELAKYVGAEPTIAEEMAYLSRCLDSVLGLCNKAEKQAGRWEDPLPVPEWVATVRAAAEGLVERTSYPPALPWAGLMDTDDLAEFLRDLDATMRDGARQAHQAGQPQAPAVLSALEKTCATWRPIAEAQHAHNTAPGPDAEGGEQDA